MTTTTDYSKLTVDELLAEEAKVKKQRIAWAFIIGGFIGIIFWAVMVHTALSKVVLLVLVCDGLVGSGGKKNEANFNAIDAELRRRNVR